MQYRVIFDILRHNSGLFRTFKTVIGKIGLKLNIFLVLFKPLLMQEKTHRRRTGNVCLKLLNRNSFNTSKKQLKFLRRYMEKVFRRLKMPLLYRKDIPPMEAHCWVITSLNIQEFLSVKNLKSPGDN